MKGAIGGCALVLLSAVTRGARSIARGRGALRDPRRPANYRGSARADLTSLCRRVSDSSPQDASAGDVRYRGPPASCTRDSRRARRVPNLDPQIPNRVKVLESTWKRVPDNPPDRTLTSAPGTPASTLSSSRSDRTHVSARAARRRGCVSDGSVPLALARLCRRRRRRPFSPRRPKSARSFIPSGVARAAVRV